MIMIIQSIDAIARQKRRDVLMIGFTPHAHADFCGDSLSAAQGRVRQDLMEWLDARGIPYMPCYGFWSDGLITAPYQGHLYLDIPSDPASEAYRQVSSHLENPDSTPRIPGVTFWLVPLEWAMQNAHHDTWEYMDKTLG